KEIKALRDRKSNRDYPLYVFAHILVPHDPYSFATDGRCLSEAESNARGDRQGYVDQVGYAGHMIQDLVTRLLADDRTPPIIMIQADEGPFPDRDHNLPW